MPLSIKKIIFPSQRMICESFLTHRNCNLLLGDGHFISSNDIPQSQFGIRQEEKP